jgi:uncharacterized membrane protein
MVRAKEETPMIDVSSAQIHLALNHLPVVAALLATAALVLGAVFRRASLRNAGCVLLVVASLAALPAYLSGEGAEEIVEQRPGVAESLIERHEDAAAQALAVTLAAGAVAAAALLAVRLRREQAVRVLYALTVVGALASTAAMGRAAHLGGQIRHDEIRPPVAGGASAHAVSPGHDDD